MSEFNDETNNNTVLNTVLDWIETIVMYIFVVILIFSFVLRVVVVEGKSMMVTLYDKDLLLVTNILYTPENNDIIVLNSDVLDKTVVKRVIAVEGQTVEIDYNNNYVAVDGEKLTENYIKESVMYDDKLEFDQKYFDVNSQKYIYKVPENCVFVLGDNRNHSSDSRYFGCVYVDDILGKVILRIMSSYGDFGFVK